MAVGIRLQCGLRQRRSRGQTHRQITGSVAQMLIGCLYPSEPTSSRHKAHIFLLK